MLIGLYNYTKVLLHCMNLWIWLFLTILHKCYSTTTILYKKSHIPKKLHLQKKRRNLFSSTYTLQHIKMKDLTFANLHGRNSRNPCLSNTFALIINASLKTFSILFFFHDRFICFTVNFQEKKDWILSLSLSLGTCVVNWL